MIAYLTPSYAYTCRWALLSLLC